MKEREGTPQEQWYACFVKSAHLKHRSRASKNHWIFVSATSVEEAVVKLYKTRGWKKNRNIHLFPLTQVGSESLEELIKKLNPDSLNFYKRNGFYGRRNKTEEKQIQQNISTMMKQELIRIQRLNLKIKFNRRAHGAL